MIGIKPEALAQVVLSIFIDFKKMPGETMLLVTLCSYWTKKGGSYHDLSVGLQYAERHFWLKRNIRGYFLTAHGLKQVTSRQTMSKDILCGPVSGTSNPQKTYSIS